MHRIFVATLALGLSASLAQATTRNEQLFSLVNQELDQYVAGADASTLSNSQLASIYSIMHTSKSHGQKGAMIRSVLGGDYSLRGLLFDRN